MVGSRETNNSPSLASPWARSISPSPKKNPRRSGGRGGNRRPTTRADKAALSFYNAKLRDRELPRFLLPRSSSWRWCSRWSRQQQVLQRCYFVEWSATETVTTTDDDDVPNERRTRPAPPLLGRGRCYNNDGAWHFSGSSVCTYCSLCIGHAQTPMCSTHDTWKAQCA